MTPKFVLLFPSHDRNGLNGLTIIESEPFSLDIDYDFVSGDKRTNFGVIHLKQEMAEQCLTRLRASLTTDKEDDDSFYSLLDEERSERFLISFYASLFSSERDSSYLDERLRRFNVGILHDNISVIVATLSFYSEERFKASFMFVTEYATFKVRLGYDQSTRSFFELPVVRPV